MNIKTSLVCYVKCVKCFVFTVIDTTQSAGASNPPSYSTDLETGLRASLYANYEVLQRPAATVTTQIQLNLLTVNFLVRLCIKDSMYLIKY